MFYKCWEIAITQMEKAFMYNPQCKLNYKEAQKNSKKTGDFYKSKCIIHILKSGMGKYGKTENYLHLI